ncbi:arylesterase [Piscinibacter koreensis]|uniref:Arylesterase n=1 Tax=Piscinibacter koreensis TaxID=2742824 RepID=A0A7Y6NS72_9BURK|nr:arylesterase [Schlegelella koreensis]NUZ08212.1 arylesterase [Schlegelella koreensis]
MEIDERVQVNAGRRRWAAHCTALLAALWAGRPLDALAGAAGKTRTILIVGDSLSAEYGLKRGSGWVALLEKRLADDPAFADARVVNASVSGETTAGGRSRLPALLKQHRPDAVVLELGGNDALRGLPLDTTRANLQFMAQRSRAAGAKVLILGLQIPPNYGRQYGERFAGLFEQVAREEKAALVPFLLKGVADVADAERLFQPDRIHPTAAAQPTILGTVWPALVALLQAR